LEGGSRNFEDAIRWKFGIRKEMLFWEDNCVGSGALKIVFPRLFSVSLSKTSKVAELGVWNNGIWDWKFAWRRSFFEWEKQLECHFSQVVQGVCFHLDKEDSWVWKGGEALSYTVKSAYNRLRGGQEGENATVFKQFWRSKALPSALVTTWRVLENKLATRVNLGKCVVESSLCSLCRVEKESNSHLFFESSFLWLVWSRCFTWLGVQFVSHNDQLLNFSQFRLSNASASVNEVWGVIWTAVVSELWKHRNNVIFEWGVVDGLEVVALV